MAKMKSGDVASDRAVDELREIEVTLDFTPNADASVLYRQGNTMILACATVAPSLPRWFPRDATRGWVHAEYSLLPGSTDSRFRRERNGAKGRTQEIERLVARALRGAIDLEELDQGQTRHSLPEGRSAHLDPLVVALLLVDDGGAHHDAGSGRVCAEPVGRAGKKLRSPPVVIVVQDDVIGFCRSNPRVGSGTSPTLACCVDDIHARSGG